MRKLAILITIFLIVSPDLSAFGLDRDHQQNANRWRKQDKLEEYLYARLDAFLENPDPGQIIYLESIEDSLWRPLQNSAEQLAYVVLKSNEGYYQLQFNQVTKAVSAYENAWKVYDSNDLNGFDIVEYCLKPLGNAYSMLGDFESAENIVKSYLLEAQRNADSDHFVSAVINLSIIYYSTGRFNEAIDILEEGLNAREMPESKRGLVYANLARNYLGIGRHDHAIEMCNQALKYGRLYPVWNTSEHLVSVYSTLSVLHQKKNELSQALQSIQWANAIGDTSEVLAPRTKAKLKNLRAGILSEMGREAEALQTYKNTLVQLISGHDDASVLPAKDLLYAENTLKEAFDGMALIYTKTDSLRLAVECYELSFEVEHLLRSGYNYREAKYLQQKENRERAEKAILLLIEMHARYGEKQYIKRAFEIAENTKSMVLKSTLHNQQFWDFVANDSLFQVQKELNRRKAQFQHALTQEKLKGDEADLKRIKWLIDQQNQLVIEMKALRREGLSKIDHLPFERGILTDSLQMLLSDRQETMIQYFWGSSHLFTFVLEGKNIALYRSDEVKSIREEARSFIAFFEDPHKINNNPRAYAELAFSLYEQLLPESIKGSLVIVPDGILNFIPFEAIVYEIPGDARYARWPWVLNKYPVAYRSSAEEILHEYRNQNNFDQEILGVFPEFEGRQEQLKYSENEYEAINAFFNGKYLRKNAATKEAFLRNVAHYPVIHLSTHANAGDLYRPPSISFIDSSLFLPEIYGLDVDNVLMVLSACETGLGKLHTGESAVSLANGFVQVGVDNIVFSLWKVNDLSTSILMSDFYRHLSLGESVSLSLRKAKQDFLKDGNVSAYNKSPYYWASFVYYGDTQLKSSNRSPRLIILTGIGLVVLCGLFFWTMNKRNL